MAPAPMCDITLDPSLPTWLQEIRLEKTLQKIIGDDFQNLLKLNISNATIAGENYSSLLVSIKAEVQLKNGNCKTISFILKAAQANEMMAQMLDMFRIFPKEEEIYHKILPRFEQLYADAQISVQFSPKAYKLDVDLNKDNILMENLQNKNYKNANRIKGLDMAHAEAVLTKMAQYHAASACYVEHYGAFSEDFVSGIFSEKNREILSKFNKSTAFLNELKNWPDCAEYYAKLADSDDYLVDRLLAYQRVKPAEFNVLNHGDCWSNNIMFQYDAFDKIKDVLFVDFALGKYGSPANDLYYFILSSCAADIKLKQFDYLIRFYYEHLIDNLKLLQYARPLPKLTSIHGTLLKNGLAAYMIVSKVLPAVILDKSDNANLENYMDNQSKMVNAMYKNPQYKREMLEILPWLNNRGLLDWKC